MYKMAGIQKRRTNGLIQRPFAAPCRTTPSAHVDGVIHVDVPVAESSNVIINNMATLATSILVCYMWMISQSFSVCVED